MHIFSGRVEATFITNNGSMRKAVPATQVKEFIDQRLGVRCSAPLRGYSKVAFANWGRCGRSFLNLIRFKFSNWNAGV
jgi:hypothetical protein